MISILTIKNILHGLLKEIQQKNGHLKMATEIVVALIGGSVTLIVALIEMTRRQNNRDHASNASKLDKIADKIDNVDSRLVGHIEWHAHDK